MIKDVLNCVEIDNLLHFYNIDNFCFKKIFVTIYFKVYKAIHNLTLEFRKLLF